MNTPRRIRLIAFFLPIAGLILLMPPMVFVFDRPGTLFGIPIIIAFLFFVWLSMILATYFLQRHLELPSSARPGTSESDDRR